jgi:hypothetical protein
VWTNEIEVGAVTGIIAMVHAGSCMKPGAVVHVVRKKIVFILGET